MPFSRFLLLWLAIALVTPNGLAGQDENPSEVTIEGQIRMGTFSKTWDGHALEIDLSELPARLRELVTLPPPPYPEGFQEWSPEKQSRWLREFPETEVGKQVIAKNRERLQAARSIEVKFDRQGRFQIFDVPVGEYGLQGRLEQEIEGVRHAFTIFARIQVSPEVDQIQLPPIDIAVAPMLKSGQNAPPLGFSSDDEPDLAKLPSGPILLHFWSTSSPRAEATLSSIASWQQEREPAIQWVAINVDQDREAAQSWLADRKFLPTQTGFAGGFNHASLRNYGVGGVPSFWLIGPARKILATPAEVFAAVGDAPDMQSVLQALLEERLSTREDD